MPEKIFGTWYVLRNIYHVSSAVTTVKRSKIVIGAKCCFFAFPVTQTKKNKKKERKRRRKITRQLVFVSFVFSSFFVFFFDYGLLLSSPLLSLSLPLSLSLLLL